MIVSNIGPSRNDTRYRLAAVLLLVLYVLCFAWLSVRRSLFLDEMGTLLIAENKTLSGFFEHVKINECKPPLYFLYARIFVSLLSDRLKHIPAVLRCSSLPFLLALFFLMYRSSSDLFTDWASGPALLFLWFFNDFFLNTTSYFRPYALYALTAFAAFRAGRFYVSDPVSAQNRFYWLTCAVLSIYVHTFALIPLAVQFVIFTGYALLGGRFRDLSRIATDAFIIFVAFLPQLPSFLHLLRHPPLGMDWNHEFGLFKLLALFVRFHASSRPSTLVVFLTLSLFLPLAVFAAGKAVARRPSPESYTAAYAIVGLLASIALGLLFKRAFHPRPLIFLFAPYIILMLRGIEHLPRRLSIAALALAVLVTGCSTASFLARTRPWVSSLAKLCKRSTQRSMFISGARYFEAWDFLVLTKYYGMKLNPCVVYYPFGSHPPVWEGGNYVSADLVCDNLAPLLKEVDDLWYLAQSLKERPRISSLLGPDFKEKESWQIVERRALFHFTRIRAEREK